MSVSSVKNLNGETFSAVQDLELTNFVQTNSGSWGGGVSLSGDAQGAVDTVYNISGGIISGTISNRSFTATNLTSMKINNTTIGGNIIVTDQAGYPTHNWKIDAGSITLGPEFAPSYWSQYQRVYLDKTGLSSMSGTSIDKNLIWKAILNTDIEGIDNTITAINGSAISAGVEYPASANEAITAYQNNSATYLTAHQDLSNYYTTAEANTLSSMLSGAIDYVSANTDYEFPISADEAIQYVQTNSGTIDDAVTSYQTNSGTFLTAHQAISAEEWNEVSTTVNTNSASWNDVSSKQDNLTFGYDGQDKISAINNSAIAGVGSLDIFPISGTGSVNVYEQTNVLWVSGKDFTSDISYISGTIGDVETLLASL